MRLLISDANILIDMESGGLLETLFRLPVQFGIPDLLYFEEIEPGSPDLVALGLQILEVRGEFVQYAVQLSSRYANDFSAQRRPSHNDYLALALARQESCTLLTGDASLRRVAEAEGVEVAGTIRLLCAMVDDGLLTVDDALEALDRMRVGKRRLPWSEAIRRLRALR